MRDKILILLAVAIFIGFSKIPYSGSYVLDNETSTDNTIAAGKWAVLSFYPKEDKLAVGFRLQNVESYTGINYAIDYSHDGGLPEHIEGAIDNSGGESTILREWFALGGCSGLGEVCWNHEVEGQINLTVELLQAGAVVETLTKSITI